MVPRYRVFAKAGVKAVYGGWYDTAQMFYEIRDIDFYGEEVTVWGCHQKNCGMCDDTYKMEDVEIMMSTGLKDKNGVEIFEGDILQDENSNKKLKLIYCECCCQWLLICEANGVYQYYRFDRSQLEVIGNIYENADFEEVVK